MVDPATGEVSFQLYPYHLDRLYGPFPGEPRTEDGLPFPFREGLSPVDAKISGNTSSESPPADYLIDRETIHNGGSSIGWSAYAFGPYGWIPYPRLWFRVGRARSLGISPQDDAGPDAFLRVEHVLIAELGPPHERRDASLFARFQKCPWRAWRRAWTYPWGSVSLFFGGPDSTLSVSVTWT